MEFLTLYILAGLIAAYFSLRIILIGMKNFPIGDGSIDGADLATATIMSLMVMIFPPLVLVQFLLWSNSDMNNVRSALFMDRKPDVYSNGKTRKRIDVDALTDRILGKHR